MGKFKFCQVLTELSALDMSIFLFLDNILIFTKFCMCIDIVEIWFGIANGQILSVLDSVTA